MTYLCCITWYDTNSNLLEIIMMDGTCSTLVLKNFKVFNVSYDYATRCLFRLH